LSPGTWESVRLVLNNLRHGLVRFCFCTRNYRTTIRKMRLYKSIPMPYGQPLFVAQLKYVIKKSFILIETRRSAATSHPPLPPPATTQSPKHRRQLLWPIGDSQLCFLRFDSMMSTMCLLDGGTHYHREAHRILQ
jgi:hypothetical protein